MNTPYESVAALAGYLSANWPLILAAVAAALICPRPTMQLRRHGRTAAKPLRHGSRNGDRLSV